VSAVTALWPYEPFTFRALRRTFGAMWLRCDVCRRYAPLRLPALLDVDSRTKTFSCSRCGGQASFCLIEPIKEPGMQDYNLDPIENARHHPDAARNHRALYCPSEPARASATGGELPGRKIDRRR